MKILPFIFFCLLSVFSNSGYGKSPLILLPEEHFPQELLVYRDSQILYNGRVWYKKHTNVRGNEFFTSALWNKGEVLINGRTYSNIDLRYDIFNDDLLIRRSDGLIIILNKNLVSEFTLSADDAKYQFRNFRNKENYGMNGFANVLYDGRTALLFKPVKEILPRGYQKIYDIFIQTDYLYVIKDGIAHRIRGRKGLLDLFNDKRKEVKNFIRAKGITVLVKEPGSVIPVLQFYDNLTD